MIRSIVVLCLLVAATPAAGAESHGTVGAWTASVDEDNRERLDLSLRYGRHENFGYSFDRSQFADLTAAQLASTTQVPVRFVLRREAGTVDFEGTFREGQGAGQFTFAPNLEFKNTLRSLGVSFEKTHGDEAQTLLALTMFDVSSDFIRSMQAIGYKVSLDEYQEFRIFGVDPAYVREMSAVGFRSLPAQKLVETRIHGATPDYIRQMRQSGNDLSLDDYIQSRIFRVTPEFKAEMGRAGYPNLDHDTLVQFRIHDVSTEFIEELKKLGYTGVPASKLVEMRIHGVTPEYIRRVNAAGYTKVPIEKLVQMRIFGIEPEMVRALDDASH